ncbi:MAG: rhodanese-related sulfurtransferase [Pseudomonadota bacterium]|nr:rhodanese-related sulfurtransferase [Pseudomonadota bacterium]
MQQEINSEKKDNIIRIIAAYHFMPFAEAKLEKIQKEAKNIADSLAIKGTLLLSTEGFNGTLAGSIQSMDTWILYLKKKFSESVMIKESYHHKNPFLRLKVKIKPEIVTMGQADIDVATQTGIRVPPDKWNQLLNDEQTVVIDTRNTYEIEIGSFKGAVNPNTTNFRDFPDYIDAHIDGWQDKNIAMFCTGGIRCEKASAHIQKKYGKQVYQLDGGILNYIEKIPESDSSWVGDCFVFDHRVSVDHNLKSGAHDQCYACRWPLLPDDKLSPNYKQGVSCSRCYQQKTHFQKKRYIERQKQIDLSKKTGRHHMGINQRNTHD